MLVWRWELSGLVMPLPWFGYRGRRREMEGGSVYMFLDREGNWVSATWAYHLILVLGFMDDKRPNEIEIYLLQAFAATWTYC